MNWVQNYEKDGYRVIDFSAQGQKNVILRVGSGQMIVFASAAPTTGTWAVGDICFDTVPVSGQQLGWVCTVAGTPGTWVAMANNA